MGVAATLPELTDWTLHFVATIAVTTATVITAKTVFCLSYLPLCLLNNCHGKIYFSLMHLF